MEGSNTAHIVVPLGYRKGMRDSKPISMDFEICGSTVEDLNGQGHETMLNEDSLRGIQQKFDTSG